jgi:putative esterase
MRRRISNLLRQSLPSGGVPPIYDRRCCRVIFFSRALGVHKSFYIFVPTELAPGERAPALYLLRGHEREWVNPLEDATRGGANVVDVYERLRAAGEVGPLILIFPGLSSDDNRVPGLIVNMRAPRRVRGAPGIGWGRFEDYFFEDLIPFVDAHFPTLPDGRHRGIAGFSLGGAMAIKAAAQRPHLFATASAYDGTFLYAEAGGQRVRASDPVLHNPIFDAAFGVPRDMRLIAASSPANLILRGQAQYLRQVTWMVGYGPERLEPWQANFYRGEHLIECLRRRGIDNALPFAAFPNGDHTWRTADAFMALTLPLHDLVFRREGPHRTY